jgi:hypothetical protein
MTAAVAIVPAAPQGSQEIPNLPRMFLLRQKIQKGITKPLVIPPFVMIAAT